MADSSPNIWYNKSTFSDNANHMASYILHKNYSSNKHKHEFYEINIVRRGTGTHTIDGRKYHCSSGDVFIIPPFISHQYVSDGNLDVCNIMFGDLWMRNYAKDCDALPGFYSLFSPLPIMCPDGESSQILRLRQKEFNVLDIILSTFNFYDSQAHPSANSANANACYFMFSASYTFSIVSFICYCYSLYGKDTLVKLNDIGTNAFAKSLHYIYSHYSEKISVDDLAKQSAMSYSTYNRVFKENFNCSPLNYINQYRISVAKHYLKKNVSVSEVASITGFFDHSHFIKAFTKVLGMTPAEYKKLK